MKHALLCAAAAAALGFLALPAGAATSVTFVGYQFSLNPGEFLVTDFDAPIAPGFTLSGTGSIMTGNNASGAAPATSPTTADTTQFLSVLGNSFSLVSGPALRQVSLYIGSLDTYNTVSFTGAGGFSQSFTGAQLNAATVAFDEANGNQVGLNTNGRYTFRFDQGVTGVRLDSTANSLEVSNIGAVAVPEPSTWALMIVGFGSAGALIRRRRSTLALTH